MRKTETHTRRRVLAEDGLNTARHGSACGREAGLVGSGRSDPGCGVDGGSGNSRNDPGRRREIV